MLGFTGRIPCNGERKGSGGGEVGGGGSGTFISPPPLLTTTTPRRTRETTIVLEEIGRGGGGTVHKAMHMPSMRLVAVKMVEVHDNEKRRQMAKELKAFLSNRVSQAGIHYTAGLFIAGGAHQDKINKIADCVYICDTMIL